jgi:hypothetical protein
MSHSISSLPVKIVSVFTYDHKNDIPTFTRNSYHGMDWLDQPEVVIDEGLEKSLETSEVARGLFAVSRPHPSMG